VDPSFKESTPFERISGADAVDGLVEAFYSRVETLSEARIIHVMHGDDLSATKRVLKRDLAELLGVPSLYSQERVHPRMKMRHMRFRAGDAERDA